MDFRNQIIEQLKSNRPELAESSLKSYSSSLYNLPSKIGKVNSIESFTNNKDEYISFINKLDPNLQTAKSLFSSLYIITLDEDYRNEMMKSSKIVNDNYSSQHKSDKQIKNTISSSDIIKKVDYLKKMLKLDPSITNYQNYFLLTLMSGQVEGIEPRRNEWGIVKVANFDKDKDNYIKKNNVIFNQFKTIKSKGQQIVHLPKNFMVLLNKYLKISKNDWLFYNTETGGLNSSAVCKRLNKIFDGLNVSCDILRSTYLSDLYKDMPPLIEMTERAEKMGHTLMTALHCYVKKDPTIDIKLEDIYDCEDKIEMAEQL